MIRFFDKILSDCDCLTTVLHVVHPIIAFFLLSTGAASWIINRQGDILLVLTILTVIAGFFILVPVSFFASFMMMFVDDYLVGKSEMVKCKVLVMLWAGGSALIGVLAMVPFYLQLVSSENMVYFLSFSFSISATYANSIVPNIPRFYIPYRKLLIQCTVLYIINALIAIGLEVLMVFTKPGPVPHTSFVIHCLWIACYMPMTWDFWFAYWHLMELGKDA